jgi:phosphatidylserine decarboxylase
MYLVVYLSPGDYHRFHSPANFTANYRRHVAGYLEPVDPRYLKTHTEVFKSNERVNLLGNWTHGFFAYCMVGATNVGSIKLNFDDSVRTNSYEVTTSRDRVYTEDKPNSANLTQDGITLKKGEEIGFFQMGSTIVMLVEIPEATTTSAKRFDLNVKPGQKLQMGELITKEL